MTTSLPRGWNAVPVSQAVDVNPTTPLPSDLPDDAEVPLYDMAAIDEARGILREPAMAPFASCRSGKTRFRNGDVLFGRITPCVENGKSALAMGVPGDLGFGSTEFYVLRPKKEVLPEYLFFFVRQPRVVEAAVASFSGSSGRQRVPSAFWESLQLPVPSIPVQERIVSVLKKAEEIRRKREAARDVAEAILPAAFAAMFGNPDGNPKKFDVVPLGQIADVKSGVTKGRKLDGERTVEVPYLRVANVQDGYLDLSDVRTIEVLPEDTNRYRLEVGDVLMIEGCGNPNYLGRGSLWRGEIADCIHQNHIFRVRTDRKKLLPEFLASLLRTRYANNYFRSCAKNSSGLSNINSSQVKALGVPLPSIPQQAKFVAAAEAWDQAASRLAGALKDGNDLLHGLMATAFDSQLTAEWESVNAQLIAEQVAFEQRLPQLIVLAFLASRHTKAGGNGAHAALRITALMKYAFLLQMEGSSKRRFYNFVPYHYGPYASELYEDLETLQTQGLVTIDTEEEDRTSITVADPGRGERAIAELPEDVRDDVAAILEGYGSLDHTRLLKKVYAKYPAYAKKSRLKHLKPKAKASRPAEDDEGES